MAFKLALSPTYSVEVTVEYPLEGGKTAKATFNATFKRCNQEQLDELRDLVHARKVTDRQLLERVLTGWGGIQEADGTEIPFNEHTFASVLNVHPMEPTLVRAWFRSIEGARAGN